MHNLLNSAYTVRFLKQCMIEVLKVKMRNVALGSTFKGWSRILLEDTTYLQVKKTLKKRQFDFKI